MNLAESMLAGRVEKRKSETQAKYTEAARAARARYEAEQEARRVAAEKAAREVKFEQSGFDSIINESESPHPASGESAAFKESHAHIGGLDDVNRKIDDISNKLVNNSWTSQMFGRHTPEEIESVFMVGTHTSTPDLREVDAHFPRIWVFLRMLSCSILLCVAFVVLYYYFPVNLKLIPAQIVIGAVAVPVSSLCLFFELNILRNVSVYRVARFVLVGGMISFLYSLFIYLFKSYDSSNFWAGPIEEFGKLLAMVVIAEGSGRLRSSHLLGFIGLPFDWLVGKGVATGARYKWILNGILFGAAVGVGFAAFETMGYAFEAFLGVVFQEHTSSMDGPQMIKLITDATGQMQGAILVRGVLSPFGHVVWSAICGGALWSVRGADEWQWKKLFHLRLLLLFGAASILHGLWDVACTASSVSSVLLGFVVVGVISWVIVIFQIYSGIEQVRKCQREGCER